MMAHVLVVASTMRFRHQLANVMADQFVVGISEHAGTGRVCILNDAILVDRHDGGNGGLQDGCQHFGTCGLLGALVFWLRHLNVPGLPRDVRR